MEYAVIQTGGKQYKVTSGMVLDVESLKKDSGEVVFDEVLLHVADDAVEIGTPFLSGLSITAKILGGKKGEKIRVSQFKAKARERRTMGHRQSLTTVEILPFQKKTAPAKKKS